MNKKQLYENIMKNIAKEVKNAIYEAEKKENKKIKLSNKEQQLVDYILGESLEESANQKSIIDRLKQVAKKGLLTSAMVLAILPCIAASNQQPVLDVCQQYGIEIQQDANNNKNDIITVEGISTNEQLAINIANANAKVKIIEGYKIINSQTLYNQNKGTYKYVITLQKNNTCTYQTPPPIPAN